MGIYFSRRGALSAMAGFLAVSLTGSLLSQAGFAGGESETLRREEVQAALNSTMLQNVFYDDLGNPLCETVAEAGIAAALYDPEAYSWVIGRARAGDERTWGVRAWLADHDWNTIEVPGDRAPSVFLTIDPNLQKAATQIVQSWPSNERSCLVAMDADTGAVLAYANHPASSLPVNANDGAPKEFVVQAEADDPAYFLPVPYDRILCGSTMKIIDTAAILSSGIDTLYTDTGEAHGVHNYGQAVYGDVTLEKACAESLNTYFVSKIVDSIGYQPWADTAQAFGIQPEAEDIEPASAIQLEFGGDALLGTYAYQSVESQGDLINASIGQGPVGVSPLSICRWAGAIVNTSGGLYEPYLLDHLETSGGEILLQKSSPEPVSLPLGNAELQSRMQQVFSGVAASYSLRAPGAELIVAKTGTAQINDSLNHILLTVGVKANGRNICFCLCRERVSLTSSALLPSAQQFLDAIAANC